jgi:hypothetical protein
MGIAFAILCCSMTFLLCFYLSHHSSEVCLKTHALYFDPFVIILQCIQHQFSEVRLQVKREFTEAWQ